MLLADAYAGEGRFEDAIELVRKGIALSPTRADAQAALAKAYAQMGKTKEARRILRQLEDPPAGRHVSPMRMAMIHCALGEKNQAIQWLEKAIEQHDAGVGDLASRPALEPLHSDPRFQDFVRRIGLPVNVASDQVPH